MSNKLLVIGLDGASFNVLDPLIEKGYLPNLSKLIFEGSRADLETTFPPITAVAWSSFMTGKNPRKHGHPPDKQEKATQTVLEQAKILSELCAVA
jgi:predicted AlkP superfamily phosphohydrolase/phosphomutase